MRLKELSQSLKLACRGDGDPQLSGLTEDSRLAGPGDLFAAVEGASRNGRDYIRQAKENGAAAVLLTEPDMPDIGPRIVAPKENFRWLISRLARRLYGNPDEKMTLVGLTGTSGKTTISYLFESMLTQAGVRAGVIGTVDFRWPGGKLDAPNTTPEGPLLYRTLASMAESGCQAAIMEVSSHALSIGRLGDMKFRAGLFTNLSRDHLDYHEDMESYFQAKRKLMISHLSGALPSCAICTDDPYGARLFEEMCIFDEASLSNEARLFDEANPSERIDHIREHRALSYGFNSDCLVRGSNLELGRFGLSMDVAVNVKGAWQTHKLTSPLLGKFNALNLLGAVALGEIFGLDWETTQRALSEAVGAPGRLEKVGSNPDYLALVDYAHKPAALKAALGALRELGPKRLIVVFGCGGDRDRGKRPLMGRQAGQDADVVILTSDNPRTEDPLSIIGQAAEGLTSLGLTTSKNPKIVKKGEFIIEADRRKAIQLAASLMERGDIALIAGKGHETYQIIGREKFPFDDRTEALQALRSQGKS
ncbi:MAG: UDP-N-acetylmuramoyl-L-alanyl-D-glutamate--2,6-diaminopimelate ligase [Deltaproteobacteria bacterium]|jgi:UDP-N-acetylmuramyl-tripeptide synthetase|nr:UDP-N-acetylmuramoyl-L-alanyl-D-glutamate--2,6-diaminopimelate ligase [Deltaproteobacteria bacterium]